MATPENTPRDNARDFKARRRLRRGFRASGARFLFLFFFFRALFSK
jgi:hypothetical protein